MFEETALLGDTWYFQEDQINDMYGKTVKWIEKERIKEKGASSTVTAKVGLNLGEILKWLGFSVAVEGGLEHESACSTKVIQELPPYQKLLIIFKRFEKESMLCDLNKTLAGNSASAKYFYCKATIHLAIKDDNPDMCVVKGKVEKSDFKTYCSKKYFTRLSSSIFEILLDAMEIIGNEKLEVFCIGTLMSPIKKPEDLLALKFYYIQGKTEDIHDLFKNKDKI